MLLQLSFFLVFARCKKKKNKFAFSLIHRTIFLYFVSFIANSYFNQCHSFSVCVVIFSQHLTLSLIEGRWTNVKQYANIDWTPESNCSDGNYLISLQCPYVRAKRKSARLFMTILSLLELQACYVQARPLSRFQVQLWFECHGTQRPITVQVWLCTRVKVHKLVFGTELITVEFSASFPILEF